jgi:hypothetical protein
MVECLTTACQIHHWNLYYRMLLVIEINRKKRHRNQDVRRSQAVRGVSSKETASICFIFHCRSNRSSLLNLTIDEETDHRIMPGKNDYKPILVAFMAFKDNTHYERDTEFTMEQLGVILSIHYCMHKIKND